ncbi:MAG: nucleotidyl transferase AbiEii/AbiGii toxin family protein [Candidatus Margulisbacteria bacterium]|nr:nucleotidyl transferase AbiEii/AbiGii toxin family protein [Candidatus Margulisiibacteriota bacterium]
MRNALNNRQNKVLKILSEKVDNFYLSGGTALAKYYFQHRNSEDLDFF